MLRLRLMLRAPPPLLSVLRHAPADRVRLLPPAWLPGRLLLSAASSPSLLPLLLQPSATASSSGGSIARLSATRLQACNQTLFGLYIHHPPHSSERHPNASLHASRRWLAS
jgi:hypothetical protein